MLKLGPPLSEWSFAEPKLTGRGGSSRGVCLEEPRCRILSAGIQSRGSGGRPGPSACGSIVSESSATRWGWMRIEEGSGGN